MFLWKSIVYGPVYSRRLGHSLGVNPLPSVRKVCNFDCIYCECGLNDNHAPKHPLPTLEEFSRELENTLQELSKNGQPLDHITFAGNGEPTLHPQFKEIVEKTVELRDRFYPQAKIALLSDAATVKTGRVLEALGGIDKPIMKLDAGTEETFQLINQPDSSITLDEIAELLKLFKGRLYVQTLFLRGSVNGRQVDNTTSEEIEAWLNRLRQIGPELVMIYSIDREPPYETLERISAHELTEIAERVRSIGFEAEWY